MFKFISRPTQRNPSWLTEQTGLTQEELSDWDRRSEEIDEWWEWFTGEALQEEDEEQAAKGGKRPLVYPLQINLIRSGLQLTAHALAGEVADTADPLVQTIVEPKENTDAARALANKVEVVLKQVEFENDTRAQDADMFLSIQAQGAAVMKVREEEPSALLPTGIRLEYFDPREFYCRWSGTDYFNLTECWIKQTISAEAARGLGVTIDSQTGLYLEYWNRTSYWVKIDGKFASDNQGVLKRGHKYGFVPFVYVPRIRAGTLWGRSNIPDVVGLVREYNSRMADTGDATHLSVFDKLAMRNIRTGYPSEVTLKDGTQVLNLGRAAQGSDPQPDIFRPGGPKLPEGSSAFTETLLHLVRWGIMTPDVAYGEDQGSQRSGATLYSRMWPLVSDVRGQRTWWTVGRNLRAEMILKMLSLRPKPEVTEDMLGHRKRQVWAPPLPVDRQQLVDEMIKRLQQHGASLEHAITSFGDVSDVDAEIELIRDDIKYAVDQDIRLNAAKAKTPDTRLSGTQKA